MIRFNKRAFQQSQVRAAATSIIARNLKYFIQSSKNNYFSMFSDSIRLTHSSERLDSQATLSISIDSFSNGLMPSKNA
jgi:hypothetical protein